MKVPCPSCGARITVKEDAPGGQQTCPACMTGFTVATGEEDLPPMEWEVQGPRGEMLGHHDPWSIRQSLYAGTFSGMEKVRQAHGDWEPLLDQPEYEEILRVVGNDVDAMRLASQNIKGWRRDASASRKRMITPGPDALPAAPETIKASEAIWEEIPPGLAMGVVAGVLLLVGVFYACAG